MVVALAAEGVAVRDGGADGGGAAAAGAAIAVIVAVALSLESRGVLCFLVRQRRLQRGLPPLDEMGVSARLRAV
jgi:hypothetical protein